MQTDSPRWKLADGTEVGIGDVVWQAGECRAYRIKGLMKGMNAKYVLQVEHEPTAYAEYYSSKHLDSLYCTHRAALEATLQSKLKRRKQLQRDLAKNEQAIAAIRAELKAQEELEVPS